MRRREILSLLAGSVWAAPCALAQPRGVPAQGPDRLRRVGVLTHFAENDDEGRARIAAFRSGLRELGWAEGSTVQVIIAGRAATRAACALMPASSFAWNPM